MQYVRTIFSKDTIFITVHRRRCAVISGCAGIDVQEVTVRTIFSKDTIFITVHRRCAVISSRVGVQE